MSFTSVSTRGRLTDVYKSPEDRLVSEQTVGVFLARKYDFDDRTENDFFLEWWEREVTGHERRGRGGCWLREGKARSMPVGEEKTWGHVWLWGGGERRVHWEVRESGKNLRSHPHPTLEVTSPESCKMLLSPLGCMIINSCIPGLLKFNSRQTIGLLWKKKKLNTKFPPDNSKLNLHVHPMILNFLRCKENSPSGMKRDCVISRVVYNTTQPLNYFNEHYSQHHTAFVLLMSIIHTTTQTIWWTNQFQKGRWPSCTLCILVLLSCARQRTAGYHRPQVNNPVTARQQITVISTSEVLEKKKPSSVLSPKPALWPRHDKCNTYDAAGGTRRTARSCTDCTRGAPRALLVRVTSAP